MAFNWPVFKTRTLSAILFAAVMLTGLFWNQWSFLILFSLIHFGCWWEYLKLVEKIRQVDFHMDLKLGFMLAGYGGMLLFCDDRFTLVDYSISRNFSLPVTGAGFILILLGLFRQSVINIRALAMAVLGVVYISLSTGMMISLWQQGIHWCSYAGATTRLPVVVILSIWINDTMAYIVGSLIGKTPLTKISPKKTWEGTIGGVLLAVVVAGLVFPLFYTGEFHWPLPLFFALIALIAAVTGTFGDLLESKLKRKAGVKDSGHLMPGHGGFLDRFDSLLLATTAVWIYSRFCL